METALKTEEIAALKHLYSLRYPTGVFAAAKNSATGYSNTWIRDNIYISIGFEGVDNDIVAETYRALLNLFLKFEKKIDYAIKHPPKHKHEYIHARYDPWTFEEIGNDWGHIQNDAIGLFLFKISELTQNGFKIVRSESDLRILQKLVVYLKTIQYWRCRDNGMWENEEEIHSSSVGACVAGLRKLKETKFEISGTKQKLYVSDVLVRKGREILNVLLPRESPKKDIDLALLSLIWPLNIVNEEQRKLILMNVEEKLVRENGVVRHSGDWYYNRNGEAEWTMGFPWLAIIYKRLGDEQRFKFYFEKTLRAMNEKGELPELYFAGSDEHNENTPLGWSQSLAMAMMR